MISAERLSKLIVGIDEMSDRQFLWEPDLRDDTVAALRELEAARTRIAELERDAARYRWLRSEEWAVYALEYGCPHGIEYKDQPEDTLDTTIDAQLAILRRLGGQTT